jgi:hypothetical protein
MPHQKFTSANASYNYCRICGHTPRTSQEEPNRTPLRFWDPDDGWVIGTLCRWCAEEYLDAQPDPEDFAYDHAADICTEFDTDEEPLAALI